MGKAAIGAAAEAGEPLRPLPATVRAAQYVRMSREHQKYSIANQATANQLYAAQHGMAVVRTYSDEGRSGLSLNRRDALKRLIADVQTGKIDFNAIIVYDVSRWGRFQDADESAYYEFICKHAGITVHYCAEQFQNDGSSLSAIVKAVKRAMAGEYSRELSVRVFAAQCRIVQQGYRLGGYAGYGLRRMLVGQNGALRGVLERGEHKCIATDRLILVPGPQNEVTTVRWIFATFVQDGKTEQQIASILNERGTMSEFGRPWTAERIRYMLKSEKYAGHNVWGHISFKLQKTKVHNAPELWVRASRVFEPIIEQSTFDAAQAVFQNRLIHPIRGRGRKYSDKMMLAALKRLCKRRGYLSRRIIDLDSEVSIGRRLCKSFWQPKANLSADRLQALQVSKEKAHPAHPTLNKFFRCRDAEGSAEGIAQAWHAYEFDNRRRRDNTVCKRLSATFRKHRKRLSTDRIHPAQLGAAVASP
jgi:DNA invertase Pin-like site-specific DNA recombinase